MTSQTPPYPYFNGITYNPSFFSSSSTGLTQGQANLLYLKKTTADTATALETFSGGLLSNSLKPIAASDILDIATTQTSGAINIGSLPSRSGNINIGYSVSAPTGLGCNINIGNILSSTSIGGKYIELASASSGIALTTSGTLDLIATAYNMGTSLVSATNINIGTAGKSTTTINGVFALTQPLTLPTTAVTPSSAQLGYYATGGVGFTSVGYVAAFPSGTALGSISSLPIGKYLFLLSYAADTFTNIGTYFQFSANITNGNCDAMFGISIGQSGATGGKTTGTNNGLLTITATSGTIALVGRTEATGTSVNVYVTMRLIRIA